MNKTIISVVLVAILGALLHHAYGPAHKINSKDFREKYGPYCIVAGASEGLGEAFAREIAQHGVNLILIARREAPLLSLAEKIRQDYKNLDVRTISVDLSNTDTVLKQLAAATSDIEVGSLIYNAAWSITAPFISQTESNLVGAVGVNVQTPLMLLNRLLQKFVERKRGGAILVSSVAGLYGSSMVATYAATKAFQYTLAKGLWAEMRSHNVDVVSCIASGIRTKGLSTVFDANEPPGTQDPQEVAQEAVQHMASKSGPVLIPGSTNRLVNLILGMLPSGIATRIIAYNTEKLMEK
jgi:hypothetical protein